MIRTIRNNKHATYSFIADTILAKSFQNKKLKIIDFGCGDGSVIKYLPENRISAYFGLDVNKHSINHAKKTFKNKKYHFYLIGKNSDLIKNKSDKADMILGIGVMQYLNSKEEEFFVKQAFRCLKKRGEIILSMSTDHLIYKVIDVYKYFSHHRYINNKYFQTILKKSGFKILYVEEKGLILSPILMNLGTLVVDIIDKILFKNRGFLGPLGIKYRKIAAHITEWEYKLPIDFGYTLYIRAQK